MTNSTKSCFFQTVLSTIVLLPDSLYKAKLADSMKSCSSQTVLSTIVLLPDSLYKAKLANSMKSCSSQIVLATIVLLPDSLYKAKLADCMKSCSSQTVLSAIISLCDSSCKTDRMTGVGPGLLRCSLIFPVPCFQGICFSTPEQPSIKDRVQVCVVQKQLRALVSELCR